MGKLDKYMRDHRDEFDDQELPECHMERFEAFLDKQLPEKKVSKSKKFHLMTLFAAAASLAILVILGVHFIKPEASVLPDDNVKISLVSEEFAQTNAYYQGRMETQIEDIMCKIENADPETKIQLQKDLEAIQAENRDFIEQIEKNDNEELAIYYLVQHYEANIQTLEFINEKLGTHLKC